MALWRGIQLQNQFFPIASMDDWKALAEKALKGADLSNLNADIGDGASIPPLLGPSMGSNTLNFGRNASYYLERIDQNDPLIAHKNAKQALENGADGLTILFKNAPNSLGLGVVPDQETLETILSGLPLDGKLIRIDAHPQIRSSADWLIAICEKLKLSPTSTSFSLGIDHGAILGANGGLGMTIEALDASMAPSVAGLFAMGIPAVLLEGDARPLHNAGATAALELGYALSRGVHHLRMIHAARQPLFYGAASVGFALSVDQDFFLSIAKLRALRLLWQRVLEDSKILPQIAKIHAETSHRMLTLNDDEGNILRNTIASSAAIIGGANSLSVVPHNARSASYDDASRRIARNTHLILAEESHLAFPQDAAAGSGTIEALTAVLCRQAWEAFKQIELEGGPLFSLRSNLLQKRVSDAAEERKKAIAAGEHPIVGITRYAPQNQANNIARPIHAAKLAKPYGVTCQAMTPVFDDDSFNGEPNS